MKRFVATAGLCGVLLLLPLAAIGQTVTEVIPLQHRSSDEIIPVLQPLLDKQGAISGMQGQLIIRTTPANLQEIKRLLAEIDTAPRRLIITVKQDVDRATEQRLRAISGSSAAAGARVTIAGGSDGDSGQTLETGRQQDGGQKARVLSSRSLESDRNTQHVQVLEGNRAFIRSGQSLPQPARGLIYSPQGDVRVIENTQMRDAVTGFSVLPRVHGDQVTLEVSPQRDKPSMQTPGAIDIQQMTTTVSGRLGEWIELGGVGQGQAEQAGATAARSIKTAGQQRKVLIKVEEAP
jgi:type II secretory pathway component GspD/PulD (secretin)